MFFLPPEQAQSALEFRILFFFHGSMLELLEYAFSLMNVWPKVVDL